MCDFSFIILVSCCNKCSCDCCLLSFTIMFEICLTALLLLLLFFVFPALSEEKQMCKSTIESIRKQDLTIKFNISFLSYFTLLGVFFFFFCSCVWYSSESSFSFVSQRVAGMLFVYFDTYSMTKKVSLYKFIWSMIPFYVIKIAKMCLNGWWCELLANVSE